MLPRRGRGVLGPKSAGMNLPHWRFPGREKPRRAPWVTLGSRLAGQSDDGDPHGASSPASVGGVCSPSRLPQVCRWGWGGRLPPSSDHAHCTRASQGQLWPPRGLAFTLCPGQAERCRLAWPRCQPSSGRTWGLHGGKRVIAFQGGLSAGAVGRREASASTRTK